MRVYFFSGSSNYRAVSRSETLATQASSFSPARAIGSAAKFFPERAQVTLLAGYSLLGGRFYFVLIIEKAYTNVYAFYLLVKGEPLHFGLNSVPVSATTRK